MDIWPKALNWSETALDGTLGSLLLLTFYLYSFKCMCPFFSETAMIRCTKNFLIFKFIFWMFWMQSKGMRGTREKRAGECHSTHAALNHSIYCELDNESLGYRA